MGTAHLREKLLCDENKSYMTRHYKISDEELAAYLDGMLSAEDDARIDAAMDIDTLEVLNVSRRAMDEMQAGNIIELPSWDDVDPASIHPVYEPLAMVGFLGEGSADEDSGDSDDNA